MTTLAGLNISPSFAEISLMQGPQLLAQRRFYLPADPLSAALSSLFTDLGVSPDELRISSRFLRRVLDTKLGGTVAQVVTSGFETWPVIRQCHRNRHFELLPKRQEPLASQELIFGVNERISSNGEVVTPLSLDELEQVAAKLKLTDVKRVVINFLFANKNPSHQKQAIDFFKEQGFIVFSNNRLLNSADEVPAWRLNILNACLVGTFQDLKSTITKAIPHLSEEKILFINSEGNLFSDDVDQVTSSHFGHAHLIQNLGQNKPVLYLGIDYWYLILPETEKSWQSLWGPIEINKPKTFECNIQPSTEISGHPFYGFNFSENDIGFEPGPISFGRALRLTVFDILNIRYNLESSFGIKQIGQPQKARDSLQAMVKNTQSVSDYDVDQVVSDLTETVLHDLALTINLQTDASEIVLVGPWSQVLYSDLQKRVANKKLDLHPDFDFADSLHTLKIGGKLL